MVSSVAKNTLLLLVFLCVGLGLAEAGARIYLWKTTRPANGQRLSIFEPKDPFEKGAVWGIKKNYHQLWGETWSGPAFTVNIYTDGNGYRVANSAVQTNPKEFELVFFGDSFTFGHGVEQGDSYTAIASKITGLKGQTLAVKNGFEPEHYEYFFQENMDLRPKLAVVGLYLGNDLGSDVAETEITRLASGEIASLAIPSRRILPSGEAGVNPDSCAPSLRFLCSISDHVKMVSFLLNSLNTNPYYRHWLFKAVQPANEPNPEALEYGHKTAMSDRAFQSLVRLNALVQERGGKMVVLLITQNFFHGHPENPQMSPLLKNKIDEIVGGNNVLTLAKSYCVDDKLDCVDVFHLLNHEDFYKADPHWNASGHRKTGEMLGHYLKTHYASLMPAGAP